MQVSGNDTAVWDDVERQNKWKKARGGKLLPGVLSVIDHDNQTFNVEFDNDEKSVGVPFKLVKHQDGQFCDEVMVIHQRYPTLVFLTSYTYIQP